MKILSATLGLLALLAASASAQIELAYDDGSPEHAIGWNEPLNGVAVRFTAPGCVLTSAKFYVWTGPYWNDLGICVLDSNGPGGAPGDTLVSYFRVPLAIEGAYQEVSFPTPITLPHADFYVVYLQTGWGRGDSNGFGLDRSGAPAGRSWLYQSGLWSLMAPADGNVMIRALLEQPTTAAVSTWGAIKGAYR